MTWCIRSHRISDDLIARLSLPVNATAWSRNRNLLFLLDHDFGIMGDSDGMDRLDVNVDALKSEIRRAIINQKSNA